MSLPKLYTHRELLNSLASAPADRGLLAIRRGAQDLLGRRATLLDVTERLQQFALVQVLDLLGRTNAVLHRDGAMEPETQVRLLSAFFAKDEVVWMDARMRRVRAAQRDQLGTDGTERFVFFEPRLVTAMAILAGAVLPPDGPPTAAPSRALGEALLMLHDLMEEPVTATAGSLDTPGALDEWAYFFAVRGFLHGGDPASAAIVRAVEIFLTPRPEMPLAAAPPGGHVETSPSASAQRVDLAAVFEERTGLSLDAYALVTAALIGTMLGIRAENAHERPALIPPGFFNGFDAEWQARFRAITGDEAVTFCARSRKAWPDGATRPTDFLPVECAPLVHTAYGSACVSVQALQTRLTSGVYHDLLNAQRTVGATASEFGQRVQHEVGRRFEQYVHDGAFRMAARLTERGRWHPRERRAPGAVRYFRDAELVAAAQASARGRERRHTPSTCDGALLVGRDLLLFECKARFFSLAARSGTDREAFFVRLREIALRGARQLEATVRLLADGRLAALGLTRERVRRVFPVLVSLETLPLNHLLRIWIDQQLAAYQVLEPVAPQSLALYPPEFMSARDFEWLELAIEQADVRPGDLLAEKQGTALGYAVSLASWAATEPRWRAMGPPVPAYHAARWQELGKQALEFFRTQSRAARGTSGTPSTSGLG